MTPRKDEHLEINASKGALSFLRWLIPLFLSGSLITGGGAVANNLDKRITAVEESISNQSVELNGSKIRLSEYDARLVEMQKDTRETREDIKRILFILTKR